ncbi:DUF6188 family protein [Spirillospora sp. CA-253888]
MDLTLQGRTVVRVCFDAAVTILTADTYELRLETPAVITTADGGRIPFDPEKPGTAAATLVSLFGQEISRFAMAEAGDLSITFTNGMGLATAADADYEAWTLTGPGGLLVVCRPGGGTAVWSGR